MVALLFLSHIPLFLYHFIFFAHGAAFIIFILPTVLLLGYMFYFGCIVRCFA